MAEFHEMEYADLCAWGAYETKSTLRNEHMLFRSEKVRLFWGWAAEVILNRALVEGVPPDRTDHMARIAVRAALTELPARDAIPPLDNNASAFLLNAWDVLPYLAFPLLETLARQECSDFMTLDGKVTKRFTLGVDRVYKVGGRCSSLADALRLLVTEVAGETLAEDLGSMIDHVGALRARPPLVLDGYRDLYAWRNQVMHGEVDQPLIGGIILTMCLLIMLDRGRHTFHAARHYALSAVMQRAPEAAIDSWFGFYPWPAEKPPTP